MVVIRFMLYLNDPRGNGGLYTPDIEVGDPFDPLGEQDTLKKEIYKSPQKKNDHEFAEGDDQFTNEVRQHICNTGRYKAIFQVFYLTFEYNALTRISMFSSITLAKLLL